MAQTALRTPIPTSLAEAQTPAEVSGPAQEIPQRLSEAVRREAETLVLVNSGSQPYPMLLPAVLGGMLALFAALVATGVIATASLGASALLQIPGLALFSLLALLPLPIAAVGATGLFLSALLYVARPVPLEITAVGAKVQHPWGRRLRNPTAVQLEGVVGGPITVKLVGYPNLVALRRAPSVHGGAWDLDAMRWFADAAAQVLQVPVQDQLDATAWHRWTTDPAFRNEVRFDKAHERNRRAFPAWHEAAPVEPRTVRYDHHGMRVGKVRIEEGRLHSVRGSLGLHEILDARAAFSKHTVVVNNVPITWCEAALQLRTETRSHSVELGQISDAWTAGETRWLAAKLRELASDAVPPSDEGSEADVPESLRDLREPDEPISPS